MLPILAQKGRFIARVGVTGHMAHSSESHRGVNAVHAAAESSKEFAETWEALPEFEHQSPVALKTLDAFAVVSDPYLDEVKPVERQLTRLLQTAKPFAPQFNNFLTAVGPLTEAAKRGLPESSKVFNLTVPVLENLRPVLHNLDPFLQYLGEYLPELQSFFANTTAATQENEPSSDLPPGAPKQHLLTAMPLLSPESLAIYPNRIGTNRGNAYPHSGIYSSLASGLPVFSSSSCASSAPKVEPYGAVSETISKELLQQMVQFGVANGPASEEEAKREKEEGSPEKPNKVPAPACVQQGPFTFNGQTSQFPHAVYSASTPDK